MPRVPGSRRFNNYRQPQRHRVRNRWLSWFFGLVLAPGLAAGLLFLIYQGLAQSSIFQVTEIDIAGVKRLSKEQVLELSGIDIHSNLVKLSSRQVRARVAGYPWVAAVEVHRRWPNRLQIAVRERVPVAILNRGGQLFYLDRLGMAFAPVVPPDDLDYPVISGWSGEGAGDSARPPALQEALQFLRYAGGGNPNLPAQNISEINIADPDDLVLILMSRPFPIRLGHGEMKIKYARLARVLSGLYKHKDFTEIAYIDLDYREGQTLVGFSGG